MKCEMHRGVSCSSLCLCTLHLWPLQSPFPQEFSSCYQGRRQPWLLVSYSQNIHRGSLPQWRFTWRLVTFMTSHWSCMLGEEQWVINTSALYCLWFWMSSFRQPELQALVQIQSVFYWFNMIHIFFPNHLQHTHWILFINWLEKTFLLPQNKLHLFVFQKQEALLHQL